MHVGDFIRERRVANGLSQGQLAVRAGTSQPAISAVESGERDPSFSTVQTLLRVMGEDLQLQTTRLAHRYEERDLRSRLARPMGRRLEEAIGANDRADAFLGAAMDSERR